MILTDQQIEELREKKSRVDERATEVFNEDIRPVIQEKLEAFINDNVIPYLVGEFENECRRVEETGFLSLPAAKLNVLHDTDFSWELTFQTKDANGQKVRKVFEILNGKAFDSERIKKLIESACSKTNTRMRKGVINTEEVFTANIELDI